MSKGKCLTAEDGGRALFLIGMGLMKKLLIADYLGRQPGQPRVRFSEALLRRRGADRRLCLRVSDLLRFFGLHRHRASARRCCWASSCRTNFNAPTRRENIADFWRRWHITFSNWLRDYLYFSLPGKRSQVEDFRLFESGHHHGDRRAVARRELDVSDLGRVAWMRPGGTALVAGAARKRHTERASGGAASAGR